MGDRSCELDMSHTLAAHAGLRDLDAAAVTDDALISDLLVFAAMAFPVFGRSENLFAEKAVPLRLESPVIDSLRLCHFTVGPLFYFFRGSEADFDGIKCDRLITLLLRIRHVFLLKSDGCEEPPANSRDRFPKHRQKLRALPAVPA